MHADAFDRYHHGHSRLHSLDPRVKVLAALVFILSNALLPDGAWTAFGLAWIILLGMNALSALGLDFTLRRSFIALPFALAAVSAIFAPSGQPLAQWTIGQLQLTPTDIGVIRFASIMLRSWLSVQGAILLVAVTPFPDIIHAFEHLRVPSVLTMIFAFLYRYLFVLTDEVMRLLRARSARSAALEGNKSGGTVFWRARIAGNMAGQLFLRSYERSDRIHSAMLARGFSGQMRTLRTHELTPRDWLAGFWAVMLAVFIQFTGRIG